MSDQQIYIRYRPGQRARGYGRDAGTIWHAVDGENAAFGVKVVCGVKPSGFSWSSYDGEAVTCPM